MYRVQTVLYCKRLHCSRRRVHYVVVPIEAPHMDGCELLIWKKSSCRTSGDEIDIVDVEYLMLLFPSEAPHMDGYEMLIWKKCSCRKSGDEMDDRHSRVQQ